ncbi:hypothetical protein [Microvirga vignae]|uniref:hypothetical protein n=1 Tax=Microvirga vignae TaxID=1225564 RepID=UPI00069A07B5|nr:hypothetical protein [Microvirga vignae]
MPPIIGLLLQYAPELIGLFAGDKTGTAAGRVADAAKVVFGTDDPQKAQVQIQANPHLAQAFVEQAKIQLEEVRLAIQDVQSARLQTLELAKQGSAISWGAPVVSVIVVVGFFVVMGLLFVQPIDLPPQQAQLLNVLFGALIPAFGTVVQYWLGSSAGSKRSGDAVRAIAETVLPTRKGA